MSNTKQTPAQRRYERGCDYYNVAKETKNAIERNDFFTLASRDMRLIIHDPQTNAYGKASAWEVLAKISEEKEDYFSAIQNYFRASQKYEAGSEHYCRCKVAMAFAFLTRGKTQQATLLFNESIRIMESNNMTDTDLYRQAMGVDII